MAYSMDIIRCEKYGSFTGLVSYLDEGHLNHRKVSTCSMSLTLGLIIETNLLVL